MNFIVGDVFCDFEKTEGLNGFEFIEGVIFGDGGIRVGFEFEEVVWGAGESDAELFDVFVGKV